MVNKVIGKKIKYCRIIGYRCSRKVNTMKKWGRNRNHERMKSRENSNRKKTSHKMEPVLEGY
jgi:hypothetical protein